MRAYTGNGFRGISGQLHTARYTFLAVCKITPVAGRLVRIEICRIAWFVIIERITGDNRDIRISAGLAGMYNRLAKVGTGDRILQIRL